MKWQTNLVSFPENPKYGHKESHETEMTEKSNKTNKQKTVKPL